MTTEAGSSVQYKPSDFAALGNPGCSCWGKSEVEWLALAYVRALAALGDTWQTLTREQVLEALNGDQRRDAYEPQLTDDYYLPRFEAVAARIYSEAGAWSVGGFWNRHRMEKLRGK